METTFSPNQIEPAPPEGATPETPPIESQDSTEAAITEGPIITLPRVLFIAGGSHAQDLAAALPEAAIVCIDDFSGIAQHLTQGPPPALTIIRIKEGHEQDLERCASLRSEAHLPSNRLVVLLDCPTKPAVMLCGKLGLVNVFPTDIPVQALAARLKPSLISPQETP